MSKLLVALLATTFLSTAYAGGYKQPIKNPHKPTYHQPTKPNTGTGSGGNTNVTTNPTSNSNSTSNSDVDVKNSLSNSSNTTNSLGSTSTSSAGAGSESNSSAGAGADASSTSGGNTLATGSTSTTNVSNVETRFLNLPSHVVPVAPSIIAGANVVQSVGACGVLQQVKREEVKGTYHGLFTDSQVSLGFRETLTGYVDTDGKPQLFKEYTVRDTTYIIGHQPVIVSSVVATGGARQFGLGGNSSSGNNGSGSLGSSGTNQQMVEHIQLTECIFQVIDNRQLTPTTNAIVPTVPTISKKIPE